MMNKNILKKTRKKLTTINTLVVGIIFILFTIFIYQYFYNLTYKSIDKELYMQSKKFTHDINRGSLEFNRELPPDTVLRGTMIYISKNGELLKSFPENMSNYIRPFSLSEDLKDGITIYKYNGHSFRQIKINYNLYTIEIIKIVDTEEMLLNQLKFVLIISIILASITVYFISKFLTKKSLKPIEESWKNQELFVQDASHELRTPLTIIFSKIESIIKRPKNSVEEEMNNLVIVMKEVRRLSKLVSDLLKLTKEDAIITINKSKTNIIDIIGDILIQYEDICQLQSKNLNFNYDLKDQSIYTDKEKLKQILIILIDNAIKYTKEDDYIIVRLSEEGSNIKIEVADSGIGIKEEELPLIFNRFYRASSHRESNKEGSGIGLSIAKILIGNLNGKIAVSSKYKTGSIFSIYIPKK
ncbi:two-component sensor histidine kinase [[Clostridium] sordellii]|uniref:histidine kinase n=2 Tax=Paraclostridium sordellii TaxID=1505 RepID=A0ABM9RPF4_PARSO|nr:HAMP domain-containing sensor histidine kinase [Paeniclostridium sordellii]CEJ73913.1 sensor histidine kinase [[Clostridium] sordellii] [Paeniclostridium sordellii]CEN69458.1 two-component sensor histidine kinase [[Clostridium] sordellii] [Paeniclostridium sordellii]CEN72726.1 two-component sensor histidine kinase [[Clostridium] sordellii] [Paeniclostridium sordellii]CEO24577.1 two-component sensor histidine kinase [[Clostridium] sordellii] [Paeniclostridium sordellii]CEP75681.1 two-compone